MSRTMELKAGRELDARVAEKVMGWQRLPDSHWLMPGGSSVTVDSDLPKFSTRIAAAWEVVGKLSADGSWSIYGQEGLGWEAELTYQIGRFLQNDDSVSMGRGDTAPLAIGRAALKAVGG